MEKTVTVEEFLTASKLAKLTAPQRVITDRLEVGWRFRLINRHRMNGGTIVWVSPYGTEQDAGHIYKALQHLRWAVRPFLNGVESIDGLFI
jgi:hypothetical protein